MSVLTNYNKKIVSNVSIDTYQGCISPFCRYYVYYDKRLERGPRPIREYGLPDELSNMDAVFIWGGNGVTYFFKGDQYWRYDDRVNKISIGYPRKIYRAWKGVPSNLGAAMKWRNGRTYFFKDRKYYRLDDMKIQVDAGYPKITGLGWMKCAKNEIRAEDEEHSSAKPTEANKPTSGKTTTKSPGQKGAKSSGYAVLPNLAMLMISIITLLKLNVL